MTAHAVILRAYKQAVLGSRVRTDFLTLLLSQAIKVNIFSRPSFSQKVLTILFASILYLFFRHAKARTLVLVETSLEILRLRFRYDAGVTLEPKLNPVRAVFKGV